MIVLPAILALSPSTPPAQPNAPTLREFRLPAAPLAIAPALLADDDADFSYTYVEVGFYTTDLDTANEETDAWRGRASLGLFSLFNIFLDYSAESYDVGPVSVDNDSYGVGVGAHFGLTSRLDLEGELQWLVDDVSGTSNDGDGVTARIGGRWMLLPTNNGGLEAKGGFRWIERDAIFSDDEIAAWDVGGRFHFLNAFSVGAEYQFLEDDSRWGLDARFSF